MEKNVRNAFLVSWKCSQLSGLLLNVFEDETNVFGDFDICKYVLGLKEILERYLSHILFNVRDRTFHLDFEYDVYISRN